MKTTKNSRFGVNSQTSALFALASCVVVSVLWSASPAFSAVGVGSASDSSSVVTSVRPYVLSANDQLTITVSGHPELTTPVTVLTDGTINFPDAGTITAAGMTVAQLTHVLVQKLSFTVNQPDVTVSVQSTNTQKASVVGAVKSPGQYGIQPNAHLLDLIAASGGLQNDPEVTQATLISSTGSTTSVDIPALLDRQDMTQNLSVSPGDVLLVQSGNLQQVQITGDVAKAGAYPAGASGISVLDLLSDAGGPAADACLSRAQLSHNGSVEIVDLRPINSDLNSPVAKLRLMPGDTLQIPELTDKVAVLGDVGKPGDYVIPDGGVMTVVTAIATAGGTVPESDVSKITVLRHGPNGSTILTKVNLGQVVDGNGPNITLQPDDIVYVPNHKTPLKINDFGGLIAPLGWLVNRP